MANVTLPLVPQITVRLSNIDDTASILFNGSEVVRGGVGDDKVFHTAVNNKDSLEVRAQNVHPPSFSVRHRIWFASEESGLPAVDVAVDQFAQVLTIGPGILGGTFSRTYQFIA